MTTLCKNCSKDISLKWLIEEKGTNCEQCSICGQTDTIALNCEDNDLTQLFKALIRYYYSEWDYNTHWGGDGLEYLFDRENPILNYSSIIDEDILNDAIMIMIDKVYEEYEEGVTLYAGYGDGGKQNMLLKSINSDFDYRLSRLNSKLNKKNYFLVEPEGIDLIQEYRSVLESFVEENTQLFRARIGFSKNKTPLWGFGEESHYKPYRNSDIGAPPPMKANTGRMNRVGVSFLYLASDINTAISEVRPYPGQIVSTGIFKNKTRISVADFNSISILNYYKNDKLLDDFLLLKSIEKLFSQPIPPDKQHKYHLTQFISDILRKLGFEGIIFKSSLSLGTNLTIFDPDIFEYIEGTGSVSKVEKLQYAFSSLKLMEENELYM